MLIIIDMRKATAHFLAERGDRLTQSKMKGLETSCHKKNVLGATEKTLNQAQLEKKIQEQAELIEKGIKPEPIEHRLTGSREVVTRTIYYLHLIGYAEVGDWSPLQPNPKNTKEVISILVRYIRV